MAPVSDCASARMAASRLSLSPLRNSIDALVSASRPLTSVSDSLASAASMAGSAASSELFCKSLAAASRTARSGDESFSAAEVNAYRDHVSKGVALGLRMGLSAGAIGLTYVFGGVGCVLAAASAEKLSARFGVGTVIVHGLMLTAIGWQAFGLIGGPPWIATLALGAAMLVFDFGAIQWGINYLALRQAITPDRLMGPMEAAHPDVHDAPPERGTVVVRELRALDQPPCRKQHQHRQFSRYSHH